MAVCPKCHTSGGNWRHCKACGMFFCFNCKASAASALMSVTSCTEENSFMGLFVFCHPERSEGSVNRADGVPKRLVQNADSSFATLRMTIIYCFITIANASKNLSACALVKFSAVKSLITLGLASPVKMR